MPPEQVWVVLEDNEASWEDYNDWPVAVFEDRDTAESWAAGKNALGGGTWFFVHGEPVPFYRRPVVFERTGEKVKIRPA